MNVLLAAVDFSPPTAGIVGEASRLARALGAKVLLVTVLAEPVYVPEYAPPPKRLASIMVGREPAVRKRLIAIQRELLAAGVACDWVVDRGRPAFHILRRAKEHDAALIVIGSHGHSALFEMLLGSTTQAVLKEARLPVVVIPVRRRKPRVRRRVASRRSR